MTTMELNLRKEYLYDLIKGMDEERLSKVETYIKRLCLAKQKESLYPCLLYTSDAADEL